MKIQFYTQNLNRRLYRRLIRYYLYRTLKGANAKWTKIIDDLVIEIYPSRIAKNDPNFHMVDTSGVGGVTGNNHITLYLDDVNTNPDSVIQRGLRVNTLAISHELAHHILIQLGFSLKLELKHDDLGGNKKGTKLNASTAIVHNRHAEKKFWVMDFWFYDWKFPFIHKYRVQVIDIRDLV